MLPTPPADLRHLVDLAPRQISAALAQVVPADPDAGETCVIFSDDVTGPAGALHVLCRTHVTVSQSLDYDDPEAAVHQYHCDGGRRWAFVAHEEGAGWSDRMDLTALRNHVAVALADLWARIPRGAVTWYRVLPGGVLLPLSVTHWRDHCPDSVLFQVRATDTPETTLAFGQPAHIDHRHDDFARDGVTYLCAYLLRNDPLNLDDRSQHRAFLPSASEPADYDPRR